jgi:hypothetical protein
VLKQLNLVTKDCVDRLTHIVFKFGARFGKNDTDLIKKSFEKGGVLFQLLPKIRLCLDIKFD